MAARWKREDCSRTKHDAIFSDWKILVGPSDWQRHSAGEEGARRYRIHNLPENFPGLYELGIARTPPPDGKLKTRKHDFDGIVVVYLGQADNVRSRLQHYGRTGSHLDCGRKAFACASEDGDHHVKAGPGLFRDAFSKGYSLVFRWAPMSNKVEAENTEARLLEVFDYAWNRLRNGPCRHEEILLKLDKAIKRSSSTFRILQMLKHLAFDDRVGIEIERSELVESSRSSNARKGFLPQVRKFMNYQPRLVRQGSDFWLLAHGSRRCEEHKGQNNTDNSACGETLKDGSCLEPTVQGRKRCELHKGRRIAERKSKIIPSSGSEPNQICGAACYDGSACRNEPVLGRKRCALHKGQKAIGTKISYGLDDRICGASTGRGYCKRKPVGGRKRCEEHKGMRVTGYGYLASVQSASAGECAPVCGAATLDGSRCMNRPVPGRKRCGLHKGRRAA